MKLRLKIIKKLLLVLFFYSGFCNGQQTKILTYEEAVGIALNESYTIKSHIENREAMQHYFRYHEAQFKPLLDFNIFAPQWNESVTQIDRADGLPVFNSIGSFRVGSGLSFKYILPTGGNFELHSTIYQENLKTVLSGQEYETMTTDQVYFSTGLRFNQPLFTTNRLRENLREAEYQYQLSSNYYTRGQMNIIYNVTAGFYSLYRATREVEINREKLANSQEAYRIAKLQHSAKRVAEAEVLIAEVEAEQDRARLSESLSNLEREKDIFKQLIGLELEQDIEIVTEIMYDIFIVDVDFAIDQAYKNRLELDDADLNIKLHEIEVDKANREREFKANISAYYDFTGIGVTGGSNTGELINSSFDNLVDRPPTRGIVLTLSYPIYDWKRGSARVQQAKANYRQAELEKENTRTTIAREVRDIVRTVEETRERLIIHEKNQELATRSYKVSRLRFENGDITSQQLGQEQVRLAEVQLAYLDAYITYQLAVADLKRKTMWNFVEGRSYIAPEEGVLK